MTESKTKRTIIDFHMHPDFCGYSLDKAIGNMDQYGIDQAMLLNWDAPETDYTPVFLPGMPSCLPTDGGPISFERCLAYKQQAPERLFWVMHRTLANRMLSTDCRLPLSYLMSGSVVNSNCV